MAVQFPKPTLEPTEDSSEAEYKQTINNVPQRKEARFSCETRDTESDITPLRKIIPFEIPINHSTPTTPDYGASQHLNTVNTNMISSPKQIRPRCVVIQEETGLIYVADRSNMCIMVFVETGQFLKHFGTKQLKCPWGILIHQDNVYVTDNHQYAIFLFVQPELTMIKRIGKYGSNEEEFNYPGQLAISPDELLYTTDEFNNRLQILNCNLIFQGLLQHKSMTRPVDVKFSKDQLLVLSIGDNPCVHIFTFSGDKLRSIITRGFRMQVRGALFFCLDAQDNIIISDYSAHDLKVFSPEGELLHTIEEGHLPGMFYLPNGITLLKDTKIVSVSEHKTSPMQIFSP